MNILIYAKPDLVEHKMARNIRYKGTVCYWTTKKQPVRRNIEKVQFSDGARIYAEGTYIDIGDSPDPRIAGIWFHPLRQVNKKQPKKPPTRGWCYA